MIRAPCDNPRRCPTRATRPPVSTVSSSRRRHADARRQDALRALRRRDVPDARGLALPGLRLQDRLLRLVMDVLETHIDPVAIPTFTDQSATGCSSSWPSCARSSARAREGGGAEVPAAPPRAGQAAGARADRPPARSRLAVSRAVAARRLRHVRRRGAGGRASSPASAASRAARC